jgi:hypothetical protein
LRDRKQSQPRRAPSHEKFLVEPLEPRVLLSGDVLAEAVVYPLVDALPPIVQSFESESEIRIRSDDRNDSAETSTLPTIFEFAVVDVDQEAGNEKAVSESETSLPERSFAQNSANLKPEATDGHDSVATQLTETLRVAHGPPGADSNQLFYLDFEGASGVSYNGPVRIEGVDVSPSGFASNLVDSIVKSLHQDAASYGATFTSVRPGRRRILHDLSAAIFPHFHSTAPFGLAEKVDAAPGRSDIAFVFSDQIGAIPGTSLRSSSMSDISSATASSSGEREGILGVAAVTPVFPVRHPSQGYRRQCQSGSVQPDRIDIAMNPVSPGNVVVLSNGGFGAAGTALRSSEFTAFTTNAGQLDSGSHHDDPGRP